MFFNMLVSAQANQLVRENQKEEEEGEGLMAIVCLLTCWFCRTLVLAVRVLCNVFCACCREDISLEHAFPWCS